MSYNIDSVEIVEAEGFFLPAADAAALFRSHRDDLPESNVFDGHREALSSGAPLDIAFCAGDLFNWQGDGSGWSYELLRDKILPKFRGRADLIFTWEGGDSFSGLRQRDGVVTEHEVVRSLGAEKK